MPQTFLVRSLSPWLAKHGARRGDYLVDRQSEPNRYAIIRTLPGAGETTGWVLTGLADGHLEPVADLLDPAEASRRFPALRVVRGDG